MVEGVPEEGLVCEPENEEVTGSGAAAEDGGYVLQLFGGHAAGGSGVGGSVVEERVEDWFGKLRLGFRGGTSGYLGGGGRIPSGEESETESKDEEQYENHEPRAVGGGGWSTATAGLVYGRVDNDELGAGLHINECKVFDRNNKRR